MSQQSHFANRLDKVCTNCAINSNAGRTELRRNYHAYTVSQFLHGEQAAMQACDEARHVAFGVQMLQAVYADMTDSELIERREFARLA